MERLRAHLHDHSGVLTDHRVRLVKVEIQMVGLQDTVETLATKEQMRHLVELMDPIRRGAYWVVGTVMLGVLGALLTLIFRK